MKLSVIIPVYNDAKYIKTNLDIIKKEFFDLKTDYELIVVDDGSTDETYERLINYPHIKLTRIQENSGKGVAFRRGIKLAEGTHILLMDSDLQISPRELKTFYHLMEVHDADAVIGDKFHAWGNLHYTPLRKLMSRTYNYMNRMLFGIILQDTQCGFKLFKIDPLKIILSKLHIRRFAFDIETIVALKENNYKVIDAAVNVKYMKKTSAVNIPTILNVIWDTIKIWIVKKMGYYRLGD